MNRPYAGRELPPILQERAATCIFGRHEIQQLVNACRYHTVDKTFSGLTVLACFDCDRLDFPRVNIKIDTNLLYADIAMRFVRK